MVHPDLLKGLAPEEAESVLALGKRLLLSTGAELFHLGDAAENIYVVVRGRLRLTLPIQVRGREEDVLVEEGSSGRSRPRCSRFRAKRSTGTSPRIPRRATPSL